MAGRDLSLTPRVEAVRDKQPVEIIVEFDLVQIKQRFDDNIQSIEQQFDVAETLKTAGKEAECKTIWRSQIVFLESSLDFYIHELSKYGMLSIFSGKWPKTDRYNNFQMPMRYVEQGLKSPESNKWLLEYVNRKFTRDVYMSWDVLVDQLNMLGIHLKGILEAIFPKPTTPDPTYRDGEKIIKDLYDRRNQIAHQSDRQHANAQQNDISKEYVEQCIKDVKSIINGIHAKAVEKSAE